ncbi:MULTISPECIES: hypothetical protein [Rossellomorea]|jgi:uncharacterized membrane protein YuzA (DUF378 family)|uniref:hypothetical protein n=1 Tax=Rossellomorea TaxID=2837508 RepID=UPI00191B5834|nr:hypothetical protein [Rossellomorea arthrocnemi]
MKKVILMSFLVVFGLFAANGVIDMVDPSTAHASTGVTEFKKGAGITGDAGNADLTKDLKQIVYLVMGIAGLWSIFWLVVGAMILQASAGNPQKRGQGIACLVSTAIGVFVIVKAYDIVGWVSGLGA